MNSKYSYILYRYSASHIRTMKDLQEAKENLYYIQKIYINDSERQISFNPIQFFAQYIQLILQHKSVKCKHKYNKMIPDKIVSDDLVLFTNNHMNNLHIVRFYIRYIQEFGHADSNTNCLFDPKVYYSQNFNSIETKYAQSQLCKDDLSSLFYVEYGYWRNIHINVINPLQFICTCTQFIEMDDDVQILQTFFDEIQKKHLKMTFDPFVYMASNIVEYEKLMYADQSGFEFHDEVRFCKHYIKGGFLKKRDTESFDMYNYMANNTYYIGEVLSDSSGNVEWNILNLTKRKAAIHYLKHYKKCQHNKFNHVNFVQENIANVLINSDKRLSIENAAQYFVESYICSKQVRYQNSLRYKFGIFCSQRVKDSLRTLPLSVSKCFL